MMQQKCPSWSKQEIDLPPITQCGKRAFSLESDPEKPDFTR